MNEIKKVMSFLRFKSIPKKGFLLKEGEICKNIFFVSEGCLRLYFVNDKGTEQITQFAIENWWMSDYMSLDRLIPSQFYIRRLKTQKLS